MDRKQYRCLLGALCAAVTLASCSAPAPVSSATPLPAVTAAPTAAAAEELDFVLPCCPSGGFHPITGSNRTNLTLAPLVYRGLFRLDRSFNPERELCAGYSVSADGLTWTFRLADAVFSDGSPLTGAEAAASLELARKSERYSGRLSIISRVTAEEDRVTVTLTRPNGALPALLDVPIVKETDDPLQPLGTGPYVIRGEGEELRLTARRDGVPLEEIPLRTVGASDDLVYAFDARQISLVDVDLTGTNVLGYSGRLETTDYPTTTLLYLGCNLRSGVCRDQAVRQAVARTVDRQAMTDRLLAGHAEATALPIHPAAEGYDQTLAANLSTDRTAAVELLAQAGWAAGEEGRLRRGKEGMTLKLVVNQDNAYKVSVAELTAACLEELGCAVTVEKLPWEEFLTALSRGDFDLYLGETAMTADFDPTPLVGSAGALNYGGCYDPQLNTLLDAYRAAQEGERAGAASALWARLAKVSPIVPLCFKNGSLLTQWGQVSGASPTQRDVFAGLESWRIARS